MLTPGPKSFFFFSNLYIPYNIALKQIEWGLMKEFFLPAFVSNKLFFIFPKVFKHLEIHEYFTFHLILKIVNLELKLFFSLKV